MRCPLPPNHRKRLMFHDIEHDLEGFETPEDCGHESQIRQKMLCKSGRSDDRALAQKLADCGPKDRCGSAACPHCCREQRRDIYDQTVTISKQFPKKNQYVVTLVLYSEAMTSMQLRELDIGRMKDRLRQQLVRSGFKNPVMGGLEFDFHEDIELWILHFHLIVLDDEEPIEKLRKYYQKEKRPSTKANVGRISRPMLVQRLENVPEQISYLCKQRPQSIRPYQDEDGVWRTRKLRLSDKRSCLVLRVLDRVGFNGLLFLYKSRQVGGEVRMALSVSKG